MFTLFGEYIKNLAGGLWLPGQFKKGDKVKEIEKRYNVVIKEIKTNKIVSIIGENLAESQADKREMTGLMRIDREKYFVDIIEVK